MRPAYSFLFSLVAVLFLGIIGAHLLDISTFNGYAGGLFLFEAGYIAGSYGRKS